MSDANVGYNDIFGKYFITEVILKKSWLQGEIAVTSKIIEINQYGYMAFPFPSKLQEVFEWALGRKLDHKSKCYIVVERDKDSLSLKFVFPKNGVSPESFLNVKTINSLSSR